MIGLWPRIQEFFRRQRRAGLAVCVTNGGFALLDAKTGNTVCTMQWADISKIQVYKLDLLTTDCICLLFESRSGQPAIQVSEEWMGFSDLFNPLSTAFPSIPENWYMEVMLPAFAEKRAILYDANGAHGTSA